MDEVQTENEVKMYSAILIRSNIIWTIATCFNNTTSVHMHYVAHTHDLAICRRFEGFNGK